MPIITNHRQRANITQAERIASAIGGGFLAAAGLKKRSPIGIALALVGGDLLRRGITGHSYAYDMLGIRTAPIGQGNSVSVAEGLGIRVDQAITIAVPPSEAFRFWSDFSNLPRFMNNLESVAETDSERSHWVVRGPAGRKVEWDAVIHNRIDGELIAWRSLPGADVDSAGSVSFKEAPAGRGTELRLEMQYNPPAGALGAAVAQLLGADPRQQIRGDLHRLKQLLETGEISTTHGQPRGREVNGVEGDHEVHRASEDSFPASDAPAYNH